MRISLGRAPTLGEMEAMTEAAFQRLPETFRQTTGNVVIRVEDFPTREVLDSLGIESEFDLLGLYQGVSLDKKSVLDAGGDGPDFVFLYRRPILHYWSEGEETLEDIVVHVLVHEIGHHFGLSDDDMERIEVAAG